MATIITRVLIILTSDLDNLASETCAASIWILCLLATLNIPTAETVSPKAGRNNENTRAAIIRYGKFPEKSIMLNRAAGSYLTLTALNNPGPKNKPIMVNQGKETRRMITIWFCDSICL